MLLTKFALRNPLLVSVLALALVCFGLYAYLTLGVSEIPNISFPGVQITTTDAGADPETVETQITKPIEDAVAALPNLQTITSTSSEGVSNITVQFTTAADARLVPVDVERVVNAVRNSFPAGTNAPTIQRFDTSAIPVVIVALYGPQSADQLRGVAINRLERTFEAIPGVQSAQVEGGSDREIQIDVDPNKLRAYGLGLNQVQQALQQEQIAVPAGQLTADGQNMNVRFNALVSKPAELGEIVIANSAGGPVTLADVATVDDTYKDAQYLSRVNGAPAVALVITKVAGGNAIQISQQVQAAMAQLRPALPQGAHMDVVFDAANYTQQSFNTIRKTLIEAIISTGIILLLFLHTWRSTLIVLVAIPTSLLTAVAVMLLEGFDLNLFSMLALTLSVGILVDDSIVVLENIYRHLHLKEPPFLAALNGRSEIGFAALTITMVDVVVYVPMALIPGIVGQILAPFALVIAAATLTSLLVSFTLTPLLASRFLSLSHAASAGGGRLAAFGRRWDRGFLALANGYRGLLRLSLAGSVVRFGWLQRGVLALTRGRFGKRLPTRLGARWAVIAAGVLTFAASGVILASGSIGFDIFPSGDQSEVDLSLTMPSDTALTRTDAVVRGMEARLKTYPEVREFYAITSGNTSSFTVLLVPPTARKVSSSQFADTLRRDLDPHLAGTRLDSSLPTAFGFGGEGGGGGQAIGATVRGTDPAVLNLLVGQVEATLRAVPGTVNVNSSNDIVEPETVFTINRPAAADLGVSAQTAAAALQTAISGTVVGEFSQPGKQNVDIRLQANAAFRDSLADLAALPLVSDSGGLVTLGQVGTVTRSAAPLNIRHDNRERSISVNASVSGRPAGSVQRDVQTALDKLALPPGYTVELGGGGENDLSAFSDILKALLAGLLLMYLLMTLLFRSLTLPLAVLMSLPLALVGALTAMALTGTPFTLFSLLGFFLLLGLVGKNAILLVDYTDTLRKRGYSRLEALLEAGPTRLRPIIMTTASVMVALTPVALGTDPGSELLKAAAVVLIGGLLTSTLLTLVFVPAMYTIFDDLQAFVVRVVRRGNTPRPLEPEELAALGLPIAMPRADAAPERELAAPLARER